LGEVSSNDAVKKVSTVILQRHRGDVIESIPVERSPSSSFYSFLKQTRKKYFSNYIELLDDAIENNEPTDFFGNETYQSYSHAKAGFELKEVLSVPNAVKAGITSVLEKACSSGEVAAGDALRFLEVLDEVLDQAQLIRSQAFIQTRDEVIRFYHSCQEEIDRFPSNLAATLDFSTLMKSAVKKAIDLIEADRCALFTRDLLTNDLRVMASNFAHERVFGEIPVKLDDKVLKELVYEREPVLLDGPKRSLPLVSSVIRKLKVKSLLLVPLMVRDRNLGVMLLGAEENPKEFTPEVVELAVRFASRVAQAMENARLHGSEQQKLKETMALLEVARLVTSTLDIDLLLSRLSQITADVCEVEKCSVYLYVSENGRFYPVATFGSFDNSDWEMQFEDGICPSELSEDEVDLLINKHEVLISDPSLSPFIPDERIEDSKTRSVVIVPICSRERILGLIVLYHGKEQDEIDADMVSLVTAIAGQAAVALENASLYENLEMSYFSTVKALAKAIEVKDPFTFGHSERVTDYALAIATRLGLSDWEKRNIKYAAALHDIGKIGIARKILNKPGTLSEEEFVHVKTHPQLGDSIIEPVAFLKESREIILHHHERYDGKGYPDGLKGEDIPLGARILAVADSFEAMMSDRPYRRALDLEDALRELEINAGKQFDPKVVETFIELVRSGGISQAGKTKEPAPRCEES